jgi:hypothetical protein
MFHGVILRFSNKPKRLNSLVIHINLKEASDKIRQFGKQAPAVSRAELSENKGLLSAFRAFAQSHAVFGVTVYLVLRHW